MKRIEIRSHDFTNEKPLSSIVFATYLIRHHDNPYLPLRHRSARLESQKRSRRTKAAPPPTDAEGGGWVGDGNDQILPAPLLRPCSKKNRQNIKTRQSLWTPPGQKESRSDAGTKKLFVQIAWHTHTVLGPPGTMGRDGNGTGTGRERERDVETRGESSHARENETEHHLHHYIFQHVVSSYNHLLRSDI